ncbi:segregation/condensation protein A [Candidatus Sumerlaeota bacterium]|nr:segregation/condensation protein A [Candidatus Sumerlaeota bacterium]
MSYNVRIDVFEGPFDLLLHLVRVHEMDIYDIPIAEIATQYLAYIKEMEKLDLDVAGEFLVMAATLVNLKSRTLMPPVVPEDAETEEEEPLDEEGDEIRSAQDLMRRLIEYRQFKEMAVQLSQREEDQLRLFYRNTVLPVVADPESGKETREDISLLFSAFARILDFTEGRPAHHVADEEFSVEEKIEFLTKEIDRRKRLALSGLIRRCVGKAEILTLLLAMLEVCRLRLARVKQAGNYQEIYLVHPSEIENDDEEDD